MLGQGPLLPDLTSPVSVAALTLLVVGLNPHTITARSEGDSGLTLEGVGALSTLVADIAARGTRTQRSDRRSAEDD